MLIKALILNSGKGSRMGDITSTHPKCMTNITPTETILSRQLKQLVEYGISEIIITTGPFADKIKEYCDALTLPATITFVNNDQYDSTNYIYSMKLSMGQVSDSDILLIHGDLVFENRVLEAVLNAEGNCVITSSTVVPPVKDFKAKINGNRVIEIGTDAEGSFSLPFYKFNDMSWKAWAIAIDDYCSRGIVDCYAEDALNEILNDIDLSSVDVENLLCREIDTPEDLLELSSLLKTIEERTVYMCFSTDIIHGGHISIINKAKRLGKLIIGVLSDEAIASFKRYPLLPYEERSVLLSNIKGVSRVVKQNELSYKNNIQLLKPNYVVHGDDWKDGFQKVIRDEVIIELENYGGELVEYPYSKDVKYVELEKQAYARLALPDLRRGRLKKMLNLKTTLSFIEAHSGITGLIAEKTVAYRDGGTRQFDGMWVSSLCDSTAKGKPDIELVDMSSRLRTIEDIMDVTSKPIILDGDTGGLTEHFVYNVKTLERMGVSAVIIEDKVGLKKNSLFGTDVPQTQATIEEFCSKITAGKHAQKTKEFMIIARIESLILEKGMEDALERAFAYVDAGADGIMIHSRKKEATEIFEFVDTFRMTDNTTPIVVVPTSFNSVTEEEFAQHGVNIVIYANQLTRSGFPAMQKAAQLILENHRAQEADEICMSIKDILTLIPED